MQAQTISDRSRQSDWFALGLHALALYAVVSLCTLPFLDALWLGELPVLVVPQMPKLLVAGWLRTEVVMPAITALGLSRGSFSPDYVLARPYALAIAYGLAVAGVLAVAWACRRPLRTYRASACLLLVLAVCDYLLTLSFAAGPGLTVY